jgi:hypothetical protein
MIGDRLLRAAKVAIAAQMPQPAPSTDDATPSGSTIDTSA